MADQFKQLDPQRDIKTQNFPSQNALLSMTSASAATTNNVSIFTIGALSGSYVYKPDSLSLSTTAGISPSGAINSIAKFFFNRYSSQYFNSASGVYTLPASHTAGTNVVFAKLIQIAQPSKNHGIWPDTLTAVLYYNGTSITAIDSSADSFGPNKESLSFGKITDASNANHVLGTIFYDYGMILLHGGTGAASAFTQSSVTGFAFTGSLTGALSASTSASTVVVQALSFKTYSMLTRNIYFCRLNNDEFNFTSNPSAQYVDFLQTEQNATTYVTTVGLYDATDNLLAVAKISPPLRKNQFKEHVFSITLSL